MKEEGADGVISIKVDFLVNIFGPRRIDKTIPRSSLSLLLSAQAKFSSFSSTPRCATAATAAAAGRGPTTPHRLLPLKNRLILHEKMWREGVKGERRERGERRGKSLSNFVFR